MLARSRSIGIGAGSLGVGLLVGAAVGVLAPGTASTQTTSTTTSSTTTTTTAGPAPSTTIPTDPPPVVLEFFANPADAVCFPGAPRARAPLSLQPDLFSPTPGSVIERRARFADRASAQVTGSGTARTPPRSVRREGVYGDGAGLCHPPTSVVSRSASRGPQLPGS